MWLWESLAMRNLGRLVRTIWPLKPAQVAWRAWYMLRRSLGRPSRVSPVSPVETLDAAVLERVRGFLRVAEGKAPTPESVLTPLRTLHFHVLNAQVDGTWDWDRLARGPRPGRSAVHWFEYVSPLAQASAFACSEDDARLVSEWIHDWMTHHPPCPSDAWSAYPIATRLMNWALAFAVFGIPDRSVIDSFAVQARWLRRSIESDVEANHLIRDAQGLIIAGALMAASAEGREWQQTGLRLLAQTLAEQVLGDGGHYERSVMYHAHVLQGNLIAYAALETKPAFLRAAIARMADFLPRVVHPDGEIPLFGDSALDSCMPPLALDSTARTICGGTAPDIVDGGYALEPSGFYVMRAAQGAAWMIAKAAPPEPSYQLGHAHADVFSYELSVKGRRIIVDSGNAIYEPDPMRAYCRSVRAHNTVAVGAREPMECWDVFRVGHRYRILSRDWRATDAGWMLVASHDGFAPFRHTREIHFHTGGVWLVADLVTGPRSTESQSYIHFHPEVRLEPRENGFAAIAGSDETLIMPFGASTVGHIRGGESPLQGWYCPHFGEAHPADCLVLHTQGPTVRFGYAIVPVGAAAQARRAIEDYRERFLAGTA